MATYYDDLEVSSNASREVIDMAYKALVKKYHPDLNPTERKQVCEEAMRVLNKAREVLTNTELRTQYDYELYNFNNPNINENIEEQQIEFFIPPRPWVRYFARFIDVYFGGMIVGTTWVIFSPTTYNKVFGINSNEYVTGAILYIIWLFFESMMLATLGTTLGKWVFNSKVVSIDGGKLKFSTALLRSFSMWFNGLGLMIPIVNFFTLSNSFIQLKDVNYGGFTKWDIQTKSAVITTKLKPIKIALFIIVCIVGLAGYNYYNDNETKIIGENNAVVQQLNDTKVNLDKELTLLTNWETELKTQYTKITELAKKMQEWRNSGNETEYNNNIDNYNSEVDYYNLQQSQFETRRLKYNLDTESYNKKYEELMGARE
jgi:curved DNA-binding protein CbpA